MDAMFSHDVGAEAFEASSNSRRALTRPPGGQSSDEMPSVLDGYLQAIFLTSVSAAKEQWGFFSSLPFG